MLTGSCARASDEVAAFRQEVESIVAVSNSSHLPLGYGFLLARGLRLTPEELLVGQSEEELQIADGLLGRSDGALRLAAFSSESRSDGDVTPRETILVHVYHEAF